ncbi:MAG TPA: hypothetical protein DIU39_02030, partial [Flavobacteriales bacterium]|nr:hypothetical protein [Flavobacteriales bacterium]
HPHPSIVEGMQECARMLLGKSIYKSAVFRDKLKCYRYDGKGGFHHLNKIEENKVLFEKVKKEFHINKED